MFQSTPSHGGRQRITNILNYTIMFQSTPSHGGRPSTSTCAQVHQRFNPRPHMEGDLKGID